MSDENHNCTHAQATPAANGIGDAAITEAALNPSSFSVEGLSQTNRSISDLITADKYLRKRALLSRRRPPICGLVSRIIPPGP